MRHGFVVLVVLFLGAVAASGEEPSPRERALARVDALIESGQLDQAGELIGHLLEHNPGDPGLLRLREKLRIRQGDLEAVLAGGPDLAKPERRAELRKACWRIVLATATGSPEELRGLVEAGDPGRLREVLDALDGAETAEARSVALELRARLGDEEALAAVAARVKEGDLDPLLHLPVDRVRPFEEAILADLRSETPSAAACQLAGRLGLVSTKRRLLELAKKGDPANRTAAVAALHALGEPSGKSLLSRILEQGKPPDRVTALAALAGNPPAGGPSVLDLLRRMEKTPPVPRLKSTFVETVLTALGRTGGPGAREALEARLFRPDAGMAAARALGALGDPAAVAAVLAYLRKPPEASDRTERATEGGLGFLGRDMGGDEVARAIELQPRLVAAVALLRMTRPDRGTVTK